MFSVRWKETQDGPYTTLVLNPAPTAVRYPPARLFTRKESKDGNVIIQRPAKDHRPRQWVWFNYARTIPSYENQWAILETLAFQYRRQSSNDFWPYVEIRDTATGAFPEWTIVKVTQVSRQVREGGGLPIYDESIIEFYIADPAYKNF